jgi:PPM family protein phosphatase
MLEKTKRLTQINAWNLDRGLQRPNNEDCLSVSEMQQMSEATVYSLGIYVVADGISGMADGERASKLATHVVSQTLLNQFQTHDGAFDACPLWLQAAVNMAHTSIQTSNRSSPGGEAGTTIVIAVVVNNQVYFANVGDSRAYIISGQDIRQVSEDHTFAAALVKAGVLSKDAAVKNSQRNRLTQALGYARSIYPSIESEELYAGDYLLLCSDGLYSQVSDDEIYKIIDQASSPQVACEALVQAANNAGGEDNIAVILVKMQEED